MEALIASAPSRGTVHFGGAELGDRRRTARLVSCADQLFQHPGGSLPAKFHDPAGLDAFYRLAAMPAVTHARVLAPHGQHTHALMRQQDGVVLVIHDTTVLDYSGLASITDLGQVGDGHGRGYYCHNSLAVTPQREVLGLAHQLLHRRRKVPKGETKGQRRKRPDRESRLWKRAVAAIPAAPAGKCWVDVADRGADITEFLDYEQEAGKHYLVRSQHNRRSTIAVDGVPQMVQLHTYARTLPLAGKRLVTVPARDEQPARTATVGVSWAQITLVPPRQPRGEERGVPLTLWVVRVAELAPPAGVEPLEWILLTNVPVTSMAEAFERVDWYQVRWVIEEYHKAQKTGCAIEQLQFTSSDRLQPVIAVLSVVAVWLLQLRDASRDPEARLQPARRWLPALWVEVLSTWRHRKPQPDWTAHDFFYALARLGGHQNRRHDRPPGWQVLWKGWTQLQAMVAGAAAVRRKRCGET